MLRRREFFSTWQLLNFDGVGSTRQIINLVSIEHPLCLLAEKAETVEQKWTLLWYQEIGDGISDKDFSNLKLKLDGDGGYFFNN